MSEHDLRAEWAASQVEAMAEGSLRGEELRRMREQMQRDPALRAAVGRAQALRAALRSLPRAGVPGGLRVRLWRIPAPHVRAASGRRRADARGRPLRWIALPLTALLIAVIAMRLQVDPTPQSDAEDAAMQEFRTAMSYLQQGTAAAGSSVVRELGDGLRVALAVSRNAMLEEPSEPENGG